MKISSQAPKKTESAKMMCFASILCTNELNIFYTDFGPHFGKQITPKRFLLDDLLFQNNKRHDLVYQNVPSQNICWAEAGNGGWPGQSLGLDPATPAPKYYENVNLMEFLNGTASWRGGALGSGPAAPASMADDHRIIENDLVPGFA